MLDCRESEKDRRRQRRQERKKRDKDRWWEQVKRRREDYDDHSDHGLVVSQELLMRRTLEHNERIRLSNRDQRHGLELECHPMWCRGDWPWDEFCPSQCPTKFFYRYQEHQE